MAHFAELDDANRVLRVVVISNDDCRDAHGTEQEAIGVAFCKRLFGGRWMQTSYSGSMRKNYAGADFTYDAARDAFIPPQPYPSWRLDENTCQWEPPVPYPNDGLFYHWDEGSQRWVEIGA